MTYDRTALRAPQINESGVQRAMLSVGHAVWQFQTLEQSLIAYLVLLYDLPGPSTRAVVEAALAKRRALTFGQLLKIDAIRSGLPSELVDALDDLRNRRNWLIHSSREDAHVALYTDPGAETVVRHIETISDAASDATKRVAEALEAAMAARGVAINPEKISEIQESWERGMRHPDEVP